MRRFHFYVSMFALCLCAQPSSALADATAVQGCDSGAVEAGPIYTQGPDCLLSWVDNNELQTMIWSQVEEDFQEASLHQSAMGYPVLTSSHWPELVDIDQDGWLDLLIFTQVGMVNGSFDIFFFDPDTAQFNHAETISGHTLERDKLGYILTTGRSGPGWVYNFYTIDNRALSFVFKVEPFGLGQSGGQFGERCDVSIGYQEPLRIDDILASGQVRDGEAFFAHYCDTEPNFNASARTELLEENQAATDKVPDDTVFYCVLDGGVKAVTVTRTPDGLFYAYGPVGGAAEIALDRSLDEIAIRSEINADNLGSGALSFTNGAYAYVIYYKYDRSGAGDATIPSAPGSSFSNGTLTRGLVVYKVGDSTAPIFHKACDAQRSYDAIF